MKRSIGFLTAVLIFSSILKSFLKCRAKQKALRFYTLKPSV